MICQLTFILNGRSQQVGGGMGSEASGAQGGKNFMRDREIMRKAVKLQIFAKYAEKSLI